MKEMYRKNIFKAIVAIAVVMTFLMSGIATVANNEKTMDDKLNNVTNTESLDFTHTVFAEFATATTCGYCKYAHAALKTIYTSGDYPFYYVSLVCNKNPIADARVKEYNIPGYPTVFFDGGYKVDQGGGTGNEAQYRSSITSCGNRAVYDVDINLNVTWLGGTEMKINVSVDNNEAITYDGTIRVYITEIKSSMGWKDTAGYLYTFPLLDWAFNEEISIPSGRAWSDSTTWDGITHGYPSVTEDNIMIIAAVFNDERHQGYSYPPNGKPFDAYYVDETTAAAPTSMPPNKPDTPSGETQGQTGTTYPYSTSATDPDGDKLEYGWDWDGDGTVDEWDDNNGNYYASGTPISTSHSWSADGTYDIQVKAKDTYGTESVWSDSLTVVIGDMPVIKIGEISGRLFKISAVIKNIGSADATKVNWSITLVGGHILLGKETTGDILCIPAGDEARIRSGLIFGFGNTVITVSAECAEGSSDTNTRDASIFLFFIF